MSLLILLTLSSNYQQDLLCVIRHGEALLFLQGDGSLEDSWELSSGEACRKSDSAFPTNWSERLVKIDS